MTQPKIENYDNFGEVQFVMLINSLDSQQKHKIVHNPYIYLIFIVVLSFCAISCDKSVSPVLNNPYDKESEAYEPFPDLQTSAVTNITSLQATTGGEFLNQYGGEVQAKGVCYSIGSTPTITDMCTDEGTGFEAYATTLTDLEPATNYQIRAYAINENGTVYGDTKSFITNDGRPTVSLAVQSSQAFQISVQGNIQNELENFPVLVYGVCYSEMPEPDLSDACVIADGSSSSFSFVISDLSHNTEYHMAAFATNEVGTGLSESTVGTTKDGIPTLSVASSSGITARSVNLAGSVTNDGGAALSEKGVCLNTVQNPTVNSRCSSEPGSTGSFTATFEDLEPGTTYYTRTYAINQTGTYYGEQADFSTLPGTPALSTGQPVVLSDTRVQLSGSVLNEGESIVTERGFVLTTSGNPTLGDDKIEAIGTGNSFASEVSSLIPSTNYNVRAYAINSYGVGYGEMESFRTNDPPTWSEVTIAAGVPISDVHFVNDQLGFLTSGDSAYRTHNGGETWDLLISDSSKEFTAVFSSDGTRVFLGARGGGPPGYPFAYVYSSTNGGLTWSEQLSVWRQNQTMKVEDLYAESTGRVVALVNHFPNISQTYGYMYYSSDNGSNWDFTQYTASGSISWDGMYTGTRSSGRYIIAGRDETIFTTTFFSNGSSTLQYQGNDNDGYLMESMDATGSSVVAVGNSLGGGHIYFSDDDGSNWTRRQVSGYTSTEFFGVVFVAENTLEFFVAGSEGTLLHTLDGGLNWTRNSGVPSTDDLLHVIYFGENNLLLTTNGGSVLIYR